jgi:hypothetical protein
MTAPIVDTKTYVVTGINGYRRPGLTQDEAVALARGLNKQMREAGWRGRARVFYRDGSEVTFED